MKKIWLFVLLFISSFVTVAQIKPFCFAFLSDTHIGSPDGKAEEDLPRTGYGYEHTPSMLMETNGNVLLGIRNGVIYSVDAKQKKIAWAYKIDN